MSIHHAQKKHERKLHITSLILDAKDYGECYHTKPTVSIYDLDGVIQQRPTKLYAVLDI